MEFNVGSMLWMWILGVPLVGSVFETVRAWRDVPDRGVTYRGRFDRERDVRGVTSPPISVR